MLKYTIIFVLSITSLSAQSDMSTGFKMLEEGNFVQAESFFTEVLKERPEDKTANICLGRAVGLGGDAPKALDIFIQTDKIYPDDFELLLNIGEAYLWNEQADESFKVYQSLIKRDSKNYTANLGSANCLFQLKNYTEALTFIDQAISIDPENASAKNSKKYILLALADEKKQKFDFDGSTSILNKILTDNPLDEQALINKAINYINLTEYKSAESTLSKLLESGLASSDLHVLMSHLSMLRHKENRAIGYASQAMELAKEQADEVYMQASIQKVNALGASKKFAEAYKLLKHLENKFGSNMNLKLAEARMKVWDREYEDGLELYNQIEEESYECHMGKAEAYLAMLKNKEALVEIEQALELNPNSYDAQKMRSSILEKKKKHAEIGGNNSSDDGGNQATEVYVRLNVPIGQKHSAFVNTGVRTTKNTILNNKANQLHVLVGDEIQWNHKLSARVIFGALSYQNELSKRSSNTIVNTTVKYQVTKDQALELAYNRQSLRYSSDLIRSGLVDNRFSLGYQYVSPKKPGVFAQLNRNLLSDGNRSTGFFTSIFYEITSFPVLKLGVNVNLLSFKESKPAVYFSPQRYQIFETFFQFGNVYDTKAKFSYSGTLAIGKQRINQGSFENTSRVELELGYRFKSNYHLSVNYFTNTAAISNAKAYSFDRIGLKLVLPM